MRQTFALFKFVVTAAIVLLTSSVAAENIDSLAEKREAHFWLKKIQSAAKKLNYSGTFIYQQGNQVRTSRITHVFSGNNEIEKLEILDGKVREYIRNNEEIICYTPETKTLLVEKRLTYDVFPAIFSANPNDLTTYYKVKKDEGGRVAGQDCDSIVLEPKDNLRYGYKLWAEKSTGLLLRVQTLNEKNEVVEQIAFTQIEIGNIDSSRAKSSFPNTNGWRIENAVMGEINLSSWTVKSVPLGFKKIREVKRVVSETAKYNSSAPTPSMHANRREVSQIVFSDGLAAISVFIEPATQSRTEGVIQQGALNIIGKRQGDFWLTIVGEVPLAAIKQIANSIEFKSK